MAQSSPEPVKVGVLSFPVELFPRVETTGAIGSVISILRGFTET